jgi:hypothetical protein
VNIEGKVIGGQTYVAVKDVAASLRERAADFDSYAEALGEPLDGDKFRNAVAYRAVAMELRARADWLDVAAVAYVSD